MAIKHIGKLKSNSRKVAVVYRTLPGDPYSALIVGTESLTDSEHDILMNMIEGPVGQNANELAEAMARTTLSDGSVMLARFHALNKLQKIATDQVIMTPNTTTNVPLNELNQMIAEQKGVALEDLAIKDTSENVEPTPTVEVPQGATTTNTSTLPTGEGATTGEQPLSDEDLAKSYRSQADAMFKEAQRLRREAEELSPTKKKPRHNCPVVSKSLKLPDDVIRHWPEVFKGIEVKSIPLGYLQHIEVTFKSRKKWIIDCQPGITQERFDKDIRDLFTEYGDLIKGVNFGLNAGKIKEDVQKSTSKVFKQSKMRK